MPSKQPLRFYPIHCAEIVLWKDVRHKHKDVHVRVYVWRTLGEMREINGMRRTEKVYALCWQQTHKVFAELHFAATALQSDLIAHEQIHAMEHLSRLLDLDMEDHEDEEIKCEIGGLLNYLVTDELAKVV